jgi:transposase, IS6 family
MARKSPFKHHRFPRDIILCAVRWYLRYPLSYQDVVDLLAERGVSVDRSSVYRWVPKFGPELTKCTEKHLRRASVDWHVDETYIRVGGRWRYLWRAIDANGLMADFRLTARRDAKAARAFLRKAIERVRLHRPVSICTDKAQSYRRVIREINHRYDSHFDSIRHIDQKWRNNLIESDHAALKRLLGYRQSFRTLRTAKATLTGIETIRTIKRGHIHNKQAGVIGEMAFIDKLFEIAA